ncbi:hypothetical protein [Streptomyces sp. NPDC055109]
MLHIAGSQQEQPPGRTHAGFLASAVELAQPTNSASCRIETHAHRLGRLQPRG